jgi:hypothetical protein
MEKNKRITNLVLLLIATNCQKKLDTLHLVETLMQSASMAGNCKKNGNLMKKLGVTPRISSVALPCCR